MSEKGEGVDRSFAPEILENIKRSSFFASYYDKFFYVLDILSSKKGAAILFTIIAFLVLGTNLNHKAIYLILAILVLSSFLITLVLGRYFVNYLSLPINESTYKELMRHKPTKAYFLDMPRDQITHQRLLHNCKSLKKIKEKLSQ